MDYTTSFLLFFKHPAQKNYSRALSVAIFFDVYCSFLDAKALEKLMETIAISYIAKTEKRKLFSEKFFKKGRSGGSSFRKTGSPAYSTHYAKNYG